MLAKTLAEQDNTAEQRRLIRQAYLDIGRGTLRTAAGEVKQRSFGSAARNVARSADAGVQYLSAWFRSRWSDSRK